MPALLNPSEAEFWVLVGLVVFLVIAFVFGRKAIFGTLDAKAVKIRADLDEAARLRAEAEALLARLTTERAQAERQAAEMLANARAEAARLGEESRARLEEQIARRSQLADRRIAIAETQAAAEVKAAAVDLAARAAEALLARRLADTGADPAADRGIEQLAGKLQ